MHKLLTRQLRAAARKDGTGVDFEAFSAIVDQTYTEFDRERRLNDRAATLMEDELKAANAQAKREHDAVLAAILDNSSEGMLVVSLDGQIAIANSAAEKQFGAQSGNLAGLHIERLLGAPAGKVLRGEYTAGELPELFGTGLDGRVFPAEFSYADLQMSDGRRQLWIVRDISERMRAQREIMESRMRFQDFAEASSDCFWEMDQALSDVTVSASIQSDFVARLPSLLRPTADGHAPQGMGEEGWRALRENLAAREHFRLRLDLAGPPGQKLHVAVAGKPVFDLEGRFRGYRGTARDVTHEIEAREAARRAERRLIEAMDAAPCAVALLDSQLQLVSGNSALRTLAAGMGERLPFGRSLGCALTAALESQAISADVARHLAETGDTREIAVGSSWYLVAAGALSDGGMVLTFSDITVLKARECELAEAKIAAESASRLKSQFLATMSHELRTPLNAILGFSEVIRDAIFGKTPQATDKYADYAGSIHTSGKHLLSLISEILDLSKIEAGSYVLDVQAINVRDIVESVMTIVSPAALKGGVDLRFAAPADEVWLNADARALRQIAINLIANAVKFTPQGGSVTIEVKPADSHVQIAITDTGIGIAKEHVATVFELFRQVDSSINRRHEGTGLGLAITKRLVELHGGTIALDSEVAVGTTVTVSLPGRIAGSSFASVKDAAA